MKIKRIDFNKLCNKEHFQCQAGFKNLIPEYDPIVLRIDNLLQGSYLPLYDWEDEAILKITKKSFPELRIKADRKRDGAFRGMIYMNKEDCFLSF